MYHMVTLPDGYVYFNYSVVLFMYCSCDLYRILSLIGVQQPE